MPGVGHGERGTAVTARVAGVVPCAGASARMGRPKALLDAGGRTFLAAVVEALRSGGCDPVIVVCAAGAEAEAREADASGALALVNPDPGEGPITSLRLALTHVDDDTAGVAYCPVDHPFVRTDTVALLLKTFARGDAPLVVPVFGDRRGHPALFRASLFAELVDPELEGGARTVVHRHLDDAELVAVDDPGVVADIDTPEAYRTELAERPAAAGQAP